MRTNDENNKRIGGTQNSPFAILLAAATLSKPGCTCNRFLVSASFSPPPAEVSYELLWRRPSISGSGACHDHGRSEEDLRYLDRLQPLALFLMRLTLGAIM